MHSTISGPSASILDLNRSPRGDVKKGARRPRSIAGDALAASVGIRKESFADDSTPTVTPVATGQPTLWNGSARTVAGAGPNRSLPPTDPTPAATGASSSNGMPSGVGPTTSEVFPDVLGLRAYDAVGSDRGQFDPSTQANINISLSPTATAGAVTTIDCVAAARTLNEQGYQAIDPKVLQAAIVAATKARRA